MSAASGEIGYPRELSTNEREWIEWILPADRPGYRQFLERVRPMVVLGEGRRGKGELILGIEGTLTDFSSPLAPVFAYGVIETNFGKISITLRDILDEQTSVEIVSHRFDDVPGEFEESRRWTYSRWKPGNACPQCCTSLREVAMHTAATNGHYALVICSSDRRLWVYDAGSGVSRLMPLTNFYNELMLHKNIRDPKIALDNKRLFADLSSYSDADLTYAFLTYNNIKSKIHLEGNVEPDQQADESFLRKLTKIFGR